MTKWNYRVVKQKDDTEDSGFILGIHEAYYDGETPVACTERAAIVGSDLSELERVLERMKESLQKPVLDYDAILANGGNRED